MFAYPGCSFIMTYLLTQFCMFCRKAAAKLLGQAERSDELWAYVKATASTGGFLSLLDLDTNTKACVVQMLTAMVVDWAGETFWEAMHLILNHLNKVS